MSIKSPELSPPESIATVKSGRSRTKRGRRLLLALLTGTIAGTGGVAIDHEMRTSALQAKYLSDFAAQTTYSVAEGSSPEIRYPSAGPYDQRLGYTSLKDFIERLESSGFSVERQAQITPALAGFIDKGGFAIYREKTSTGIELIDQTGQPMFSARYPTRVFKDFREVPKVVSATLLFIENRELLDPTYPMRNPAVEWDRFTAAVLHSLAQTINPDTNVAGGSTLATQIEKYRHSTDGLTSGSVDKLRQMISASVRAYLDGPDTTLRRQSIVVDYLNSTPLSAKPGFGEINGIGDGLWAWYGTELNQAVRVLSTTARNEHELAEQARIYKQVLSLLIAQRRPSFYLIQDRDELNRLADNYLRIMYTAGIIDVALRDAALFVKLDFQKGRSEAPDWSYIHRKAANSIRARLLGLLGITSLYQLDRLDLKVETSLDGMTQAEVTKVLEKLGDSQFLEKAGLTGFRLLKNNQAADRLIYSVTLYEARDDANYVRVQADNLDQPLDINDGSKLDLGSTAKLRTLISYLEAIARIHGQLKGQSAHELRAVSVQAQDPLTRWTADTMAANPGAEIQSLLGRAMMRTYSASPHERFFTGGGEHTFANFDSKDDGQSFTVSEAFRHSVNLPFVRMMRDIVRYQIATSPEIAGNPARDPNHPDRQIYLSRFADKEGRHFTSQFRQIYAGMDSEAILTKLASRTRRTPASLAVVFRQLKPAGTPEELAAFIGRHGTGTSTIPSFFL